MGKKNILNKRNIICLLLYILIVFFAFYFVYSFMKIFLWLQDNKANKEILSEVTSHVIIEENNEQEIKNKYTINFNELKKINLDIVGWIKVNGTEIEYPVLQTENNTYYLAHGLDKSENSAGSIFVDYRNKLDSTDKNLIIYGHNRKDGSMFGSLKKILSKSWYTSEENRKIVFITETEECIYEVFSVYKIKKEDYYIQTQFSDYYSFLNKIKERSIYNFGINLDENSQILTLSTCDNNNEYRTVLHAKKVED